MSFLSHEEKVLYIIVLFCQCICLSTVLLLVYAAGQSFQIV